MLVPIAKKRQTHTTILHNTWTLNAIHWLKQKIFRWKIGKLRAETKYGREIDVTLDSDTCDCECNCKLLVRFGTGHQSFLRCDLFARNRQLYFLFTFFLNTIIKPNRSFFSSNLFPFPYIGSD